MRRKKATLETLQPEKAHVKARLTVQPTDLHKDLLVPVPDFEPRPGHYHVVRLGPDGQEISGSDFSIGDPTFTRTYKALTQGNNPTYLVKKNPK